MEDLVAPIPVESQKLALEGKSQNTTQSVKGPAPLTGGCRIEGYVRVKKVNFISYILNVDINFFLLCLAFTGF